VLHCEEWLEAKGTWTVSKDPVERAALWYTMIEYSFGCLGRNLGRALPGSGGRFAGKIKRKLSLFPMIHDRLNTVFLENADWSTCFKDYDTKDTTIYCDPPYYGTNNSSIYGGGWTQDDQVRLLRAIFNHQGFVALSGYGDKITDKMPWTDVYEWKVSVSVKSGGNSAKNNKEGHEARRSDATEKLYIKEEYA
jgi:DNA adenine methylase